MSASLMSVRLASELESIAEAAGISPLVGLLGLPLPGVEMKMVPAGEKMELRVRGQGITQGYLKNPEKTAEAFDEEGFYKLGDAAIMVDEK